MLIGKSRSVGIAVVVGVFARNVFRGAREHGGALHDEKRTEATCLSSPAMATRR